MGIYTFPLKRLTPPFIAQTAGDLANGWQLIHRAMLLLLQQGSLHFKPNINPPIHSTTLFRNLSASSRATSPRIMTSFSVRQSSLGSIAPLEAILFDIDGTLCDSDPFHYYAFREMLQEIGFNGGEPISEEFFIKNISGMHNEELCHVLFPNWEIERARKFMDDKEAMFRRLASEQLKSVTGLEKLCKWVEDNGLKRAAVTNAPRPNAELIISILGLGEFFQQLIIGSECERAKPFPDPYLKALQELGLSSAHVFIFEIKDDFDVLLWWRDNSKRLVINDKIHIRGSSIKCGVGVGLLNMWPNN